MLVMGVGVMLWDMGGDTGDLQGVDAGDGCGG